MVLEGGEKKNENTFKLPYNQSLYKIRLASYFRATLFKIVAFSHMCLWST